MKLEQKDSVKVYLAAPLFCDGEIAEIKKVEKILATAGCRVFSPRLAHYTMKEFNGATTMADDAERMFITDRINIDDSDMVVALYYGLYSDSGTAWEIGYAFGTGKPVIVVCIEPDETVNLMPMFGSMDTVSIEDFNEQYVMDICRVLAQDIDRFKGKAVESSLRTFLPEQFK